MRRPGTFLLTSDFVPKGDQVQAIDRLTEGLRSGARHQVLKGVTGSGKTFTMANIIERVNRPVLVISHNKTLAAQLYQEFRRFFPRNAVEYFVSYYDYYQPEAFIPASNTYIAKEATINDEIDRLRLCATNSLFARRDVIIVASVSCIYGIGAPETYYSMSFSLAAGEPSRPQGPPREARLDPVRARRRANSSAAASASAATSSRSSRATRTRPYRIELEDGRIKAHLRRRPAARDKVRDSLDKVMIHPRTFFSTPLETLRGGRGRHRAGARGAASTSSEAGARSSRPSGSRSGRSTTWRCSASSATAPASRTTPATSPAASPASRPYTLLDYFPNDFLTIIDESHVTVPQIGGMYFGDRSRKLTLIEHGFRLPSALDNRPLNFDEFEGRVGRSSTSRRRPGLYELKQSPGRVVEQVIRPTGLTDPEIEIRPVKGQVDDLMAEIQARAGRRRADPGHDPDQEDGRGPDPPLPRARAARPLPPFRDRDARPGQHPPGPAQGRIRRPHRHQPPPRRSRPARGLARGHPRRRQGRLPALRHARSSRPSAGRPATSPARPSSTPMR